MTAPAQTTSEQTPAAERRLSLYEITGELAALDELLEETDGEVTPEIEAWMVEFGPMLMRKVDSIGRYCANLTAAADACKAEEERLARRRKAQEGKVKSLKRLLEVAMHRLGESRLEGSTFAAVRQKNGGAPTLTVSVEPQRLPRGLARLVPATTVADTDAIRAEIKRIEAAGGAPEGSPLQVEAESDGAKVLVDWSRDGKRKILARLAGPTYSVRLK